MKAGEVGIARVAGGGGVGLKGAGLDKRKVSIKIHAIKTSTHMAGVVKPAVRASTIAKNASNTASESSNMIIDRVGMRLNGFTGLKCHSF
jgi:hypothetical protein